MNKYFEKYESTAELHRELTNILLLATEESNFNYCYCDKFTDKITKCGLCSLSNFLFHNNNLMDSLPPNKFYNYIMTTEVNWMSLLLKYHHFLIE